MMHESQHSQQSIHGPTAYEKWIDSEGVPVVDGFFVEDLRAIEVGPWARKGGKGCILRLEGAEGKNDGQIVEIAPGGELEVQRHLYEELVYIVSGRGSTTVWNGQAKSTFEWQEGSVFAIPLNSYYQHYNASGSQAVRYYAVTSAPLMMNLFHNEDFIYNCEFEFTDRFGAGRDDFSGVGTAFAGRVWETNFIADVREMALQEWDERGVGSTNIMLELADSSMCGHVSEFPVGMYKKAHRHGAGAHVLPISGQGYSLMWQEGQPKQKISWRPGSVLVPPEMWFHQHFNSGGKPARYLALRWGGKKHRVFKDYKLDYSIRLGGNQIEHQDEDPEVLKIFEEELAKNGIESRMSSVLGRDVGSS